MKGSPPPAELNLLELIPENSPDLLALLDANGLFLYANPAHFLRLGRNPESLVGASVLDLVHPEDAALFDKIFGDQTHRRTVFRLTARWLKEEGRAAAFESSGKWIPVDGGRSCCLVLSSREILVENRPPAIVETAPELRADAGRLLALAEGEKNQVARAIHDDLGQKLTALSLELSLWKTELTQGKSKSVNAIREKLAVIGDLTNGMISFTRQLTTTLRPRVLEEFGLTAALEWHLEKVQRQTGVACSFSTEVEKLEVDPFTASQVFRIAEEVVAARLKSGCRSLVLRLLTQEDALALIFEDSGKERLLAPEITSRVRLLGGEIEVNGTEGMIVIALPLKSGS